MGGYPIFSDVKWSSWPVWLSSGSALWHVLSLRYVPILVFLHDMTDGAEHDPVDWIPSYTRYRRWRSPHVSDDHYLGCCLVEREGEVSGYNGSRCCLVKQSGTYYRWSLDGEGVMAMVFRQSLLTPINTHVF